MQMSEYINALPDSYKKTPDSNNYKLLLMEQKLYDGVAADRKAMYDALDIYTATGKTLDLFGATYKQQRGSLTDEQYRYMILQKAASNFIGCDTNSVIEALATIFRVSVKDFGLEETGPCEVALTNLPFEVVQNLGLTDRQLYETVSDMLPLGVVLAPLDLGGTFEFSASDDEASDEAGFADIEQTVGGYFGLLATDENYVPK